MTARGAIYLPWVPGSGATTPPDTTHPEGGMNPDAAELARLWKIANWQRRQSCLPDKRLVKAATWKANDMAQHDYVDHVDSMGRNANQLVRDYGYVLPVYWLNSGNHCESVAGGYESANAVLRAWLDSPGHRRHVAGEDPFFAMQTVYGIGHFERWWVLITAPDTNSQLGPMEA